MVAEAVADTEVEQPIGDTPAAPESTPEPETPEVDDEAALDAVLAEYTDEGTGETKDDATSTEGTEPPVASLTPEEAFERGKQAQAQSVQQQQSVAQRQAQERGLRQSFDQRKPYIVNLLTQAGLDAATVLEVANQFDYHHGAAKQLNDIDLRDATAALQQSYAEALYQTAAKLGAKELPQRRSEHLQSENPIETFLQDFADTVIKSKGYVTPAEAKKQKDDAVRAFVKKLPDEAKAAIGWKPSSTSTAQNAAGTSSTYRTTSDNDRAFNEGRQTRESWKSNDDRLRGKK